MAMFPLTQDLRVGLRRLFARHPLSTFGAVALLGLAMALVAVAFSWLQAVLWQPWPMPATDELVVLSRQWKEKGSLHGVMDRDIAELAADGPWQGLAALRRTEVRARFGNGPERLDAFEVSADYFRVLGVPPVLGRTFDSAEFANIEARAVDAGAGVVILSQQLWELRFGAARDVLGRVLLLDQKPFEIIGILPPLPESTALGSADLWLPYALPAAGERPQWGFSALGRLQAGSSVELARSHARSTALRLETTAPELYAGWSFEVGGFRQWTTERSRSALMTVAAASILLLLVAGITVAALYQIRAVERVGEMAVRRALGASAGRVVSQVLAETLMLSLSAALVAAFLAAFFLRVFGRWLTLAEGAATSSVGPLGSLLGVPGLRQASLDWQGLGVLATAALFAGFVVALPAVLTLVHSSRGFAPRLGARAPAGDPAGRRWGQALIVIETALATVALVVSVLLVLTVRSISAVDPGFEAEGLITARLELPSPALAAGDQSSESKEARIARLRALLDELAALPGVDSVALAGSRLPLTGGPGNFELYVEGRARPARPDVVVNAQFVSPGFFDTLAVPLVSGRDFTASETWESSHNVVVNRRFAEEHWPVGTALGRWIEFGNGERGTIIGVVENVRQMGLEHAAAAEVFLPWGMAPAEQYVVLREAAAGAIGPAWFRQQIVERVPGGIVDQLARGESIVSASFAKRRFVASLVSLLALLTEIFAVVGLYGVVARTVLGQKRQIGIRIALGAGPGAVVAWVLARGLPAAALGLGLGFLLSIGAGAWLEGQIYGVSPYDWRVPAVAIVLVLGLACAVLARPASKAAGFDPASLLRDEG